MPGWIILPLLAIPWTIALLAGDLDRPEAAFVPPYAESEDERLRRALADLEAGNYESAWFRFWDLSLAGEPAAQVNLAQLYRDGLGIPTEPQVARRWIELAASAGHPLAQYRLGEIYETSGDRRLDLQIAALWYERAAQQGFEPAKDAATRVRRRLR